VVLSRIEVSGARVQVERDLRGGHPTPRPVDAVGLSLASRDANAIAEVLIRVARSRADLVLERDPVIQIRQTSHRPHLRAVVARTVEEARDGARSGGGPRREV